MEMTKTLKVVLKKQEHLCSFDRKRDVLVKKKVGGKYILKLHWISQSDVPCNKKVFMAHLLRNGLHENMEALYIRSKNSTALEKTSMTR